MTEKELAEAMEKARQERMAAFGKELRKLAEKHGCDLVARPYIAEDGTIKCSIQIIATR